MCWWRSGTAPRSTARTTCGMRTASSSCARRKRSKRCFMTAQMLSLIAWPSLSAAVGSISRGIWDIAFPTSTAPSALQPLGRSPSCAAPGSRSATRPVPCTASRRSGGSPKSCGSSSTTGSAGSSSSITICSTSPAKSPPTCGAGRGRGSSVSSVVCYLLGLSHIDPVATRLFIGRFLNETLASVPDIDLDFPREIREELIRRVYTRYGHEHVGLVCSFPTYRLRSTVREIGKALDLPPGEIEQVAKLADRRSGGLADELDQLPGFAGRRSAPVWKELCELAEEIAGLPRHISQHVGGMVISSRPLVEVVPLERAAMEDRVVCQWDKDSCDDARFVKIDFLALRMLSLVEESVELIAVREGTPPDLSRIDFEDPAVYDRICRGDTVGLFQIESRAQIQMIRRSRPRNLEDLAVEVAIVRPGPIVGGAVNPYVRRREDQRRARAAGRPYEPPLEHPLLKEALAETLGVILYQDQVLQVCQALAGFTAGQAEALRRAMSRRRSRELMAGFWEEFRDGAAARGVPEQTAERVFTQVIAFSEFGFPKSHAAAFGLLAYQSAWLRHYHPDEYYCALFNNQPMGFYSLDVLGRDAERNGVEIRLPDVNASDVWCTIEKGAGSGEQFIQMQ